MAYPVVTLSPIQRVGEVVDILKVGRGSLDYQR